MSLIFDLQAWLPKPFRDFRSSCDGTRLRSFHLFTRELFDEAMLCFNTYNNENPNDPVALKMMDLCNEMNCLDHQVGYGGSNEAAFQ